MHAFASKGEDDDGDQEYKHQGEGGGFPFPGLPCRGEGRELVPNGQRAPSEGQGHGGH